MRKFYVLLVVATLLLTIVGCSIPSTTSAISIPTTAPTVAPTTAAPAATSVPVSTPVPTTVSYGEMRDDMLTYANRYLSGEWNGDFHDQVYRPDYKEGRHVYAAAYPNWDPSFTTIRVGSALFCVGPGTTMKSGDVADLITSYLNGEWVYGSIWSSDYSIEYHVNSFGGIDMYDTVSGEPICSNLFVLDAEYYNGTELDPLHLMEMYLGGEWDGTTTIWCPASGQAARIGFTEERDLEEETIHFYHTVEVINLHSIYGGGYNSGNYHSESDHRRLVLYDEYRDLVIAITEAGIGLYEFDDDGWSPVDLVTCEMDPTRLGGIYPGILGTISWYPTIAYDGVKLYWIDFDGRRIIPLHYSNVSYSGYGDGESKFLCDGRRIYTGTLGRDIWIQYIDGGVDINHLYL